MDAPLVVRVERLRIMLLAPGGTMAEYNVAQRDIGPCIGETEETHENARKAHLAWVFVSKGGWRYLQLTGSPPSQPLLGGGGKISPSVCRSCRGCREIPDPHSRHSESGRNRMARVAPNE